MREEIKEVFNISAIIIKIEVFYWIENLVEHMLVVLFADLLGKFST